MHLILAFLGTVVTILILVNRLSDAGLDIGWLNPFTWRRRRAWRKKFEGNPVFSLSEPMEVAALLSTAVAKLDGEISREEKAALLELFKHEFNRTDEEAADLLRSSTFLYGDGDEVTAKPDKILSNAVANFSEAQARSTMQLIEAVAQIDSANENLKTKFVSSVRNVFDQHFGSNDGW